MALSVAAEADHTLISQPVLRVLRLNLIQLSCRDLLLLAVSRLVTMVTTAVADKLLVDVLSHVVISVVIIWSTAVMPPSHQLIVHLGLFS